MKIKPVNSNKEKAGIERLFDEEYVQQLITVSGIDPKKLSEDFVVWNPFYNGLCTINACFIEKYNYFSLNEPWNADYCKVHLEEAVNFFAIGDTLHGLTAANQAYGMAGCGSITPFFYNGQQFDIPVLEMISDISSFNSEMENLIIKYH